MGRRGAPIVGLQILVLALATGPGSASPPRPAKLGTVRGVVKDREGKPLSYVQVRCDAKPGRSFETGDDGRFAFDEVPLRPCELRAWLLGTPREGPDPDVKKTVHPGPYDCSLIVDRGPEVIVHVTGVKFDSGVPRGETSPFPVFAGPSLRDTKLWVETRTNAQWTSFSPAVQHGDLAFRRVTPGSPWVLHLAWTEHTQGTYFGSGEHLKTGEMVVTLEHGKPITGTAVLPPPPEFWAGPPRDRVLARRGPVTVEGSIDAGTRTFSLPPLPSGSWRVSVRSSRREAARDAEAGSTLHLEPK
jgi:hypothetical protein